MQMTRLTAITAAFLALVGCGKVGAGQQGNNNAPAGDAQVGDAGPADAGPPWGARFSGTVWGPHPAGEQPLFPVSGALVALSLTPPGPIPNQAYCEPCVPLDASIVHTFSAPDGSFTVQVAPGTQFYLVVQKGQFRRVRAYVAPTAIGDYTFDAEFTTLPNRTDAAQGDTIPNIALVYGDYDHIEDVLAKVGMGQTDGAYGMLWGSEAGIFEVYDNSGPGEPGQGQPIGNLLNDLNRMLQYHVIVFACSYNANFGFMQTASVQQNLLDYVAAGGKLYVSDYAYQVVEQPWGEFAWFTDPLHGGCNELGFPDGCNHGPPFDAPGDIPDPDMAAWLDAMGELQGLQVLENWNTIGQIDPGFVGFDPEHGTGPNGEVYLPPKVWVEGPWDYPAQELIDWGFDPAAWDLSPHPFTISWPYQCGRVLYTTYHTVGSTQGGRHPGLYPQEKILFYLLMEVTVCQDAPIVL